MPDLLPHSFLPVHSLWLGVGLLGCSGLSSFQEPAEKTFDGCAGTGHISSAHRAELEKVLSVGEYELLHSYLSTVCEGTIKGAVEGQEYSAILAAAYDHRDGQLERAKSELGVLDTEGRKLAEVQTTTLKKMYEGDESQVQPKPARLHLKRMEVVQDFVRDCESKSLSAYLNKACRTGLAEISVKASEKQRKLEQAHLSKLGQAIDSAKKRSVAYRTMNTRRMGAVTTCVGLRALSQEQQQDNEQVLVGRVNAQRNQIRDCALTGLWKDEVDSSCLTSLRSKHESETKKIWAMSEGDGVEPGLDSFRYASLETQDFGCLQAQGCRELAEEYSGDSDELPKVGLGALFTYGMYQCGNLQHWMPAALNSTRPQVSSG